MARGVGGRLAQRREPPEQQCVIHASELVTDERPSGFSNEVYYATRPVERVSYNAIAEGNTKDGFFFSRIRERTGIDEFDLPIA